MRICQLIYLFDLSLSISQAVEREMAKRDTHTRAVMKSGQDLVDSGHYSSDTIQSRMLSIQNKWRSLHDVAGYRKKKIQENLQLQQFIADYNDIMSWLDMMERIVANDDLGYDEASADALLKKHKVGSFDYISSSCITSKTSSKLSSSVPSQSYSFNLSLKLFPQIIEEDIENYASVIKGLHDQVDELGDEDKTSPEVVDRCRK